VPDTPLPRQAPDNPRLSSGPLITSAVEFAAAADAYRARSKRPDWFVVYYQFALAIELALKAFAIQNGATEQQLRRVSHNLEKALELGDRSGLQIQPALSEKDRIAIGMLSDFHVEGVLRYPEVRGYQIPPAAMLRDLVDRIIRAAYVAVWGQARYDWDHRRKIAGLFMDPAIDYREP
jgi:hypothetical protein